MMPFGKFCIKIKNVVADGHRTVPLPFPGRFPTRLAVGLMSANNTWQKMYVGKPCKAAVDLANKFIKQPGIIVIAEFDKGGAIRVAQRPCPRNAVNVTNRNPLLERYYHPFEVQDSGDALSVWRHRQYPKLITTKRHGSFYVYSRYEKMVDENMLGMIQEYRQWLGKNVQLWKS